MLQRAMVFTLTAAMLVGTPLTASAAPLNEVFQVEDGFGNVTDHKDNTRTGTVTATDTNSGVLDANADLLGISLEETNLEFELPGETQKTLEAKLEWSGTKDQALEDELLKTLNWESSDTAVAAIEVPGGAYGTRDDRKPRNEIQVNAKGAGTAVITVTLKSEKYGIYYTAQAAVTVVQYAEKISFDTEKIAEDAFSGNVVNPNDWVVTKPEQVSDRFTYAFLDSGKISQYNAKKNTLTFKKGKTGTIYIKAIGEKTASNWQTIKVEPGNNVKTIAFYDNNGRKTSKDTIRVNDGLTKDVTVKATGTGEGPITDKISWSSQKSGIVEIETAESKVTGEDKKCTATLKAVSAGKTKITAQASSGKKATLTVTVSADLSKIKIVPEDEEVTLYSGQVVDLYKMANQYFGEEKNAEGNENFTDAGLKWAFVEDSELAPNVTKRKMGKVASIKANGVLTIKPDITNIKDADKTDKIVLEAQSKKKIKAFGNQYIKSNKLVIDLEQISIASITVTKRGNAKTVIAGGTVNDKGKLIKNTGVTSKDELSVGSTGVYDILVTAYKGSDQKPENKVELNGGLVGWNASGNGKIVKAERDPDQNGILRALKKGSSTITINGAAYNSKSKKYVAVKTTFKATVKAPSRTLKLTVKKPGIAATGKKQTITITPVLEKGTTTKKGNKGDITFTPYKKNDNGIFEKFDVDFKDGKLKLTEGSYKPGDVFKVTAKITNGPSTSIELKVVKESKGVQFNKDESTKYTGTQKIEGADTLTFMPKVLIKNGNVNVPSTPGQDNVSPVSYTVNKTGIIMIRKNADGTVTIIPTAKGSVKLTATTLDGKKGSLSIQVKSDPSTENSNSPSEK